MQTRRLLTQSQTQAQIASQGQTMPVDRILSGTLAATFASVFYFFGYYYWRNPGRVPAGG